MVVQLEVFYPTGAERIIDVCENKEQMKNVTVMDVKKKIEREGKCKFYFFFISVSYVY